MTKQGRGWDFELHLRVETTTGQLEDLFLGVTRDPRHADRKVGVFAVGDGPSVLLRLDGDVSNGTELIEKIRHTLAELLKLNRAGGV